MPTRKTTRRKHSTPKRRDAAKAAVRREVPGATFHR